MSEEVFKRLYSVREAARYLGISQWAVRHLNWSSKLPCVRQGRRIGWNAHQLRSFSVISCDTFVGRAAAFAGFALTASAVALTLTRPDVVVATSPPLTAAIPGYLAARARWRGVPWIFEMRDLWPESAVTTGVLKADAPLTRALYALERWACSQAARVNVLTPALRASSALLMSWSSRMVFTLLVFLSATMAWFSLRAVQQPPKGTQPTC